MAHAVCWHYAAWNQVLKLHPASEIPQAVVVAEIERQTENLANWAERGSGEVAGMPWH